MCSRKFTQEESLKDKHCIKLHDLYTEVKFFEGLLLKTQWNKQVYYVYVELHKTHRRGGHIGHFFVEVFNKIRLLMILMR